MNEQKARLVFEAVLTDDKVRAQFMELHQRMLQAVHEMQLSPRMMMAVEYGEEFAAAAANDKPLNHHPLLSERQLQIAILLCQHYSVKRMAEALYVSENTIKKHIQNIKKALELQSSGADFVYELKQKLYDYTQRGDITY